MIRKSLKDTSKLELSSSERLRERQGTPKSCYPSSVVLCPKFNLGLVPKTHSIYPRIQNYNCNIRVVNCPNSEWMLHNVIGCFELNNKKHRIIIKLCGNKLEINTKKLRINGRSNILKAMRVIKATTDFLQRPQHKITRRVPDRKKRVVEIDTQKLRVVKPREFFRYIRQQYNDFYTGNFFNIDTLAPMSVEDYYDSGEKPNAGMASSIDQYDNEQLVIKIDVFSVTGVKCQEKAVNLLKNLVQLINRGGTAGRYISPPSPIVCDEFFRTTHIVYQVRFPSGFTDNLHEIHNKSHREKSNIEYCKDMTITYEHSNFPALVIKLFGVLPPPGSTRDRKNKITLQIFDSGFVTINGFKNETTLASFYPRVMMFLSEIIPVGPNGFIKMFSDLKKYDGNHLNNDETKMNNKLEFALMKDKDFLDIIKRSCMDENETGVKFRKSDVVISMPSSSNKTKRQFGADLSRISDDNAEFSEFYDETYKLLNFYPQSIHSLPLWSFIINTCSKTTLH